MPGENFELSFVTLNLSLKVLRRSLKDLKRLKPLVAFATVLTGHCARKTSWVPHFFQATHFNGSNIIYPGDYLIDRPYTCSLVFSHALVIIGHNFVMNQ